MRTASGVIGAETGRILENREAGMELCAQAVLFRTLQVALGLLLVVVALVNSALSLYYYLRVLAPMFVPRPPADVGRAVEPWAAAVAVVCAVLTVGLGVAAFVLFPLPGAGPL